ncbi:glycosyltransferase [Clostridium sp.]|uniref:glycosyltransferase n=1 Tax=Clostridium sp. TaxID=1506 RepID=UPI003F40A28F
MKKKIIVTSKFNIMQGERNSAYASTQEIRKNIDWIEERMDIFYKYTLKCLKKQTNQDFIAVYAYDDSTEVYIQDAINKRGTLPENIMFVPKSKYEYTIDDLSKGYDRLYLTRLDSDDLYINTFIETLHNIQIKDDTEALTCNYGYMYDSVNNRIAKIWHMSFTFYTLIYKLDEEAVKYYTLPMTPLEYLTDLSHFDIMKYRYEYIDGYNFIWNIHGKNAYSVFAKYDYYHLKTEQIINSDNIKNDILSKFI